MPASRESPWLHSQPAGGVPKKIQFQSQTQRKKTFRICQTSNLQSRAHGSAINPNCQTKRTEQYNTKRFHPCSFAKALTKQSMNWSTTTRAPRLTTGVVDGVAIKPKVLPYKQKKTSIKKSQDKKQAKSDSRALPLWKSEKPTLHQSLSRRCTLSGVYASDDTVRFWLFNAGAGDWQEVSGIARKSAPPQTLDGSGKSCERKCKQSAVS